MKAICRAALSLCVLSLVLGCGVGGADIPDIGHVVGTVTMDSKPLSGALVTFQPEGGRPSAGRTDENGKYELVYSRNNNGALPGMHVVSISTLDEGDPDSGIEATKETIPAKYNVQSELTTTVVAGDNTIDFDLDSEGEIIEESCSGGAPDEN